MAMVNVYNWEGKETGAVELAPEIFGVKSKKGLLHEMVRNMTANRRQVLAHTKTKGEVSGGGKKPWRQKGTGRARAGSIRSPLWRGGGVIFGPRRDRNFKVKINKKTKRLAFLMALSEKVKNKGLLLLENFNLETPKTKLVSGLLKKLPIKSKRVLIVFPKRQETKNMSLAARNITNVEQADLGSLNLLDLLKSGTILTVKDTVDYWHKTYKQ